MRLSLGDVLIIAMGVTLGLILMRTFGNTPKETKEAQPTDTVAAYMKRAYNIG